LKAENKSGISSKRGLIFGASVVDYDYEGEIHINLINTTSNNVIIQAGEKIVQFVPFFQPYMKSAIEYNSLDELYKGKNSSRGSGGFGSSGEK
jgi:dUTPase